MSVAGIILAAGFSRRLGQPKQDVVIHGETLLQRTVRVAQIAQLTPLLVVVQGGIDLPDGLEKSGCQIVRNPGAEEGIASSIRAGTDAVMSMQHVVGAVFMTCDQVGMSAYHLRALYAAPDRLTASRYAGKNAVPAFFPRNEFSHLLAMYGDTGARTLLGNAHAITAEELRLDVDTAEDIERARQFLREENPVVPAR